MSKVAPVVLFAYARPDHLRRTVASLLRNAEAPITHLYVYCDGTGRPEHQSGVQAVRDYVESIIGFASVTRIHHSTNLGLSRSVIQGVTATLREHGRTIVLEDDLVVSRHFLKFMNEALDCYHDDTNVASIHGYCYPTVAPLPETFFICGADCWGWATWARAWSDFQSDGRHLLHELRSRRLVKRFDLDGAYPYTRMLEQQIEGRNDSWAIRWHAASFLNGSLTLYPGRSLVHNIGNDASGTHAGVSSAFDQLIDDHPVRVDRIAVAESISGRAAFVDFFRSQQGSRLRRAARRLRERLTRAVA